MSNLMTMNNLLGIAISDSEKGNINFNALRSLLATILEHLQIGDYQENVPDNISINYGAQENLNLQSTEERLEKLEKIISLENHKFFKDIILEDMKAEDNENKLMSNAWHKIQMTKNIETNSEGLNKLMEITDQLMFKFTKFEEMQSNQDQKLLNLTNIIELNQNKLVELDSIKNEMQIKIKRMEEKLSKLRNNTVDKIEFKEAISQFVTTSYLENLLDDYVNKNEFNNKKSFLDDRFTDLEEQLKVLNLKFEGYAPIDRLTQLNDRFNNLLSNVDGINRNIKEANKLYVRQEEVDRIIKSLATMNYVDDRLASLADRDSLNNLVTVDDLEARLKDYFRDKNWNDLIMKHKDLMARCDEADDMMMRLEMLCDNLEKNKMDKNKKFIEESYWNELVKKSDHDELKRTLSDIDQTINQFMKRMNDKENEYSGVFENMNKNLNSKLNKNEFSPIKRGLDQQLKMIMNKLEILKTSEYIDIDEAAGLQKQLLQKLNCLSCSKTMHVRPKSAIPSLPFFPPMPMPEKFIKTRSAFERGVVADLDRQCGGAHTQINTHQRIHTSSSTSELALHATRYIDKP